MRIISLVRNVEMDTSPTQLWKLTLLLFTGSQWKANAVMDLCFCCFPNIDNNFTRGEKIHNCDICGKSYPRLSTLKLHKKTHRTTKEFQCLYCNQQYGAGGKRNIVSVILLIKLWTFFLLTNCSSLEFSTQIAHMERTHPDMPRQYQHNEHDDGVYVVVSF